jgi:hypothetical protein
MSKKISTKPRTAGRGAFQYGYIATARQMAGRIEPEFAPCWWAQYQGNGDQEFFDTKRECLAWIRSYMQD